MTTDFRLRSRLILILFLGLSAQVYARVDYKADIFELGSNRTKKLFTLEHQSESQEGGLSEEKALFSDLSGTVVMRETSLLKGSELIRTTVDQLQTGETSSIQVEKGRVFFLTKDKNGKEKKNEEKLADTLVVPGNFNAWVKKNWQALAKGETLEFRYGVWHRQETVGFKFFKIKEEGEGQNKSYVFKMKASSFVIAALVDPLIFKYAEGGEALLAYEGRVAPKRADGKGGFSDLDAEVVYTKVASPL